MRCQSIAGSAKEPQCHGVMQRAWGRVRRAKECSGRRNWNHGWRGRRKLLFFGFQPTLGNTASTVLSVLSGTRHADTILCMQGRWCTAHPIPSHPAYVSPLVEIAFVDRPPKLGHSLEYGSESFGCWRSYVSEGESCGVGGGDCDANYF
jgi:hypothetical protein